MNKKLSIPERHMFKIAKSTLKMSDAGAAVMGGMTKDQARDFLFHKCGWSTLRIQKFEKA